MLDQTLRLAPLLSPVFAALVVGGGWFVAQRSHRANKRHGLSVQYLLQAYRRLENAANREDKTDEQTVAFESAVADIPFLGRSDQIAETVKDLKEHASVGGRTIDNVLSLLRNDLRKKLGLSPVNHPLVTFGPARDRSSEWRPGRFQVTPVCRTTPVHAHKGPGC